MNLCHKKWGLNGRCVNTFDTYYSIIVKQLNRDVRESSRKDKKTFLDYLAIKAENAVMQHNRKRLCEIT